MPGAAGITTLWLLNILEFVKFTHTQ